MITFVLFYLLEVVLIPMCLVFTMPFHNVRWTQYAHHIIFNRLNVKIHSTSDEVLIEKGFILANHRTFTDFVLDPFISGSAVIGRRMGFFAVFWCSILGIPEHRIFMFIRGKEKRDVLFQRMKKHFLLRSRLLFFPEGTRCRYTHLASKDDVKTHIKYGLLKEIYYDKTYPVQLQISNNKEVIFDEKNMIVNYGVHINTHRTKSIHPKDFATEADFYDAIAVEWYNAWKITHLPE